MKIGLGTAQFGADYGISNKAGRPSHSEIKSIIDEAYAKGVRLIDTAPSYNCEKLLGELLKDKNEIKIVSKTIVFKKDQIGKQDVTELENSFFTTLTNLKREQMYALMVHHCDDLLKPGGEEIWLKLVGFKNAGLIEKVGVSVYTGEQIDSILEKYEIDIIQLPINVFDQRLIISGHLKKLKKLDVETHARSVFLQGLLLMKPEQLDKHFTPIKGHLHKYNGYINNMGLRSIEAAIDFVYRIKEIDKLVIGVNNLAELHGVVNISLKINNIEYEQFAMVNEKMLNPSKWFNN